MENRIQLGWRIVSPLQLVMRAHRGKFVGRLVLCLQALCVDRGWNPLVGKVLSSAGILTFKGILQASRADDISPVAWRLTSCMLLFDAAGGEGLRLCLHNGEDGRQGAALCSVVD